VTSRPSPSTRSTRWNRCCPTLWRIALGAQATDVVGRVVKEAFWLAALGLAIGTCGAIGMTRLMANMVYGVSATDPLTFAAGILLVIAVALAASWVPAARAGRADPMEVLRGE
jgi:putative ABC transport system permease protein